MPVSLQWIHFKRYFLVFPWVKNKQTNKEIFSSFDFCWSWGGYTLKTFFMYVSERMFTDKESGLLRVSRCRVAKFLHLNQMLDFKSDDPYIGNVQTTLWEIPSYPIGSCFVIHYIFCPSWFWIMWKFGEMSVGDLILVIRKNVDRSETEFRALRQATGNFSPGWHCLVYSEIQSVLNPFPWFVL